MKENQQNSKCVCGEQECVGGAEVEIGGEVHRPNNPCYVKEVHDIGGAGVEIKSDLEWKEEPVAGWPKTFLDAGTKEVGIDLSVMIRVVSQILSQERKKVREEIREEMGKLKRYDIDEQITNSEGAFHPTEVEMAREESYNEGIADVLKIIRGKENV